MTLLADDFIILRVESGKIKVLDHLEREIETGLRIGADLRLRVEDIMELPFVEEEVEERIDNAVREAVWNEKDL